MPENDLRAEYDVVRLIAEKMRVAVGDQLEALVRDNNITLGTPLESRVKTWDSLEEKIQRNSLTLESVSSLHDLVGLRLILLFQRDVDVVCELILNTFKIEEFSDIGTRLSEMQFGYQSRHFIVRLPDAWRSMPTLKGTENMRAEIQVRTLAQHIWAASSHKLQYKRESSVPPPVRRAIHRMAALLETVDLEIERVLQERDSYQSNLAQGAVDEALNVDILNSILKEMLPAPNRDDEEEEKYDSLLRDLTHQRITTAEQLRQLITRHLTTALADDARQLTTSRAKATPRLQRRHARGVYYTYVGLIRVMLGYERRSK